MDPITGPMIAAGGDILGGVISGGMNFAKEAQARQFQRETMQNAIRWRVEDAKAAGLHPLFALGANVGIGQPMALGDQLGPALAEAGQDIGTAVTRMQNATQNQKDQLELQLLRSQTRESDARAGLYSAEAAKINQAGQTGLGVQPEAISPVGVEGQHPNAPGMIDIQPAPQVSSKEGRSEVAAGQNPYFEEQLLAPDFPIMLPRLQGESAEEIISEMNPVAWLGLLLRNQQVYGGAWLEDLLRFRYAGKDPRNRYKRLGLDTPPLERYEKREERWKGLSEGVRDAIERAIKKQGGRRRFKR